MELFLDIETIPSQSPEVRAEIEAKHAVSDVLLEIRPAANLTDPAKIAADILKRTDKAKADLAAAKVAGTAAAEAEWRDTSLNGGKGHVFSVAWAWDDKPVQSFNMAWPTIINDDNMNDQDEIDAIAHQLVLASEATMLGDFFAAINRFEEPKAASEIWSMADGERISELLKKPVIVPRVIAHHAQFDIRFLWQRGVVHGIRPPWWWPIEAKPWDRDRLFDTMTAWAGIGNRVGLDKLCRLLGIDGKDGIDGSKVWDAVRDGRSSDVVDYNRDDVERLRACFRRLTFVPPAAKAAEAA
jgi:3'-5' exonuclease